MSSQAKKVQESNSDSDMEDQGSSSDADEAPAPKKATGGAKVRTNRIPLSVLCQLIG